MNLPLLLLITLCAAQPVRNCPIFDPLAGAIGAVPYVTPTNADLMEYARKQARIDSIDYFHPRYARADEVRAWRRDRARRDAARRRILHDFPARARSTAELVPGRYYGMRLVITPDGIDYTPGQYASVEIYHAVFDYFQRTNEV